MSYPTIDDMTISVQDNGRIEVSSYLTRGRAATVVRIPKSFVIVWAVIASYRGGLTDALILQALEAKGLTP